MRGNHQKMGKTTHLSAPPRIERSRVVHLLNSHRHMSHQTLQLHMNQLVAADEPPPSRLIKRLSTLTGPSHLSVGLPPSSLSPIALRQDASDGSDPLVENMLRALIHADTTPRSDRSDATPTPRSYKSTPSPLTPTVLGLDLPAGRVEALPDHRRLAQVAWEESREWGSGFAQVARACDSPTAAIRRRLTSIRCAPSSPRRRCASPYLRRPVQARQAVRHQTRTSTLQRPSALSPLSPATTRANRQRGWGQAMQGPELVVLRGNGKGRVMVS